MANTFDDTDKLRFDKWFFKVLSPEKRKIFLRLWCRGTFNRVSTLGSPFLFDSYIFAGAKLQEEMRADEKLKGFFTQLKDFDLTEKDTDGLVYIWRSGILDEYPMGVIEQWMKDGSTDKSS